MTRRPSVSAVDILLEIRSHIERVEFLPYIVTPDAHRLLGLLDGYALCCLNEGLHDARTEAFFLWLRDVKKEHPPDGWQSKYLRDCNNDHLAAIKKLLDFVAEFVEQEDDTQVQR